MRLIVAALTAASLSVTVAEAQTAATFSFIDSADNIDLTGQVLGSLSGNYFTVLGVSDLTYNGQPVAFTPTYDGSLDAFLGFGPGYNGNGTAVITLDGSYMDWLVYNTNNGGDGFYFANGDITAQMIGGPLFESGNSFGDTGVVFNPADWTLNVSVPEPAALSLMAAGVALVGVARRKRGRSLQN